MALERGLGRGLGALLGDAALQSQEGGSLSLPISQVEPGLKQPRKRFDEESLQDLADSIRIHGIIQPLTVRRLSSGYQIIAGERRWRAAKLAGLNEIPAVIIEADDRKVMELGLIENLQREDLNPIEEAAGFQSLMETYHMTQEEAASRVGKSRSAVANALRLLSLTPPVAKLVEEGKLSAGHARALLGLPNEALIYAAAEQIVSHKLTVRDVEKLAKRSQQEAGAAPKPRSRRDAFYDEVELALKETLGRKVRVVPGRGKGTLEIEFYSNEDLKDLANKLGE